MSLDAYMDVSGSKRQKLVFDQRSRKQSRGQVVRCDQHLFFRTNRICNMYITVTLLETPDYSRITMESSV